MFSAIQIAAEYVERFKSATSLQSLGHERYAILCTNEEVLAELLSELEQRLQGRDMFNSPRFKALADKAQLDFQTLVRLRETKQQKQVELGDLGEAISCLTLLAYFDCAPQMLFPKNLGKLNARVSDPGIDIVILRLPGASETDSIGFIESKATGTDGRDFTSLFSAAQQTTKGISVDRVYDEIRLLSEEVKERPLPDDASERVKLLVFSFVEGLVKHTAHLHALDDPTVTVGRLSKGNISAVVMFRGNMDTIRQKTFAYRRSA
ncbi:MAG: hypothetical protein QOJ39_2892 [Candidatus Eremiobacteraeota bacterium]|jgi:hypothetical protein|nr:hypothetical protein [Candidatus Eremiobacteraeota bacterium]